MTNDLKKFKDMVNTQLPLSISPAPESVARYHFYVDSASNGDSAVAPSLKAAPS